MRPEAGADDERRRVAMFLLTARFDALTPTCIRH